MDIVEGRVGLNQWRRIKNDWTSQLFAKKFMSDQLFVIDSFILIALESSFQKI